VGETYRKGNVDDAIKKGGGWGEKLGMKKLGGFQILGGTGGKKCLNKDCQSTQLRKKKFEKMGVRQR